MGNTRLSNMKGYLYFFRYWLLSILVLILLLAGIKGIHAMSGGSVRGNGECLTEERVFDYADKLTDREEEKLRKLISKREKQIGCDIVLVTLNESLRDYAAQYEEQIGPVPVEQYVMVYADNFYDENKFGYDKPWGDGAVYVDNWHKEFDGYRYTWFSTSGAVQDKYTDSMINHLIDRVIQWTNISPYLAYKTYVNTLYYDMVGFVDFTYHVPAAVLIVVALIITGVFVAVQLSGNNGKVTTAPNTYVKGDGSRIRHQADRFITKRVTSRVIKTESSGGGGGGGGGHISSGGHSHGGGGGRH